MKIYPAIDLIDGKVVRLRQGDFDQKTDYQKDPVATAKEFAEMGAKYLHVVDLDGAKSGKPAQTELIKRIAQESKLELQVGGGVRTSEDVGTLLDAGVNRVILGSIAVNDPDLTKNIFETYSGDRLTLGLDVRLNADGRPMVATHGWKQTSNVEASSLLSLYLPFGLGQVLCTDIGLDGMMQGPNFALYMGLSSNFPTVTVLASGGVSSLDDLKSLKAKAVGGAIIGKALYEGAINLKEALEC